MNTYPIAPPPLASDTVAGRVRYATEPERTLAGDGTDTAGTVLTPLQSAEVATDRIQKTGLVLAPEQSIVTNGFPPFGGSAELSDLGVTVTEGAASASVTRSGITASYTGLSASFGVDSILGSAGLTLTNGSLSGTIALDGMGSLIIQNPAGTIQVATDFYVDAPMTVNSSLALASFATLGLFGATPISQPAAVADATDAATAISQLNALLARLRSLGVIAM